MLGKSRLHRARRGIDVGDRMLERIELTTSTSRSIVHVELIPSDDEQEGAK